MELTIQVASQGEAMGLFGLEDRNLKLIRDALSVNITARNGILRLSGEKEPVEEAAGLLNGLLGLIRSGTEVSPDYVKKQLDAIRGRSLPRATNGATPTGSGGIRVQTEPIETLSR